MTSVPKTTTIATKKLFAIIPKDHTAAAVKTVIRGTDEIAQVSLKPLFINLSIDVIFKISCQVIHGVKTYLLQSFLSLGDSGALFCCLGFVSAAFSCWLLTGFLWLPSSHLSQLCTASRKTPCCVLSLRQGYQFLRPALSESFILPWPITFENVFTCKNGTDNYKTKLPGYFYTFLHFNQLIFKFILFLCFRHKRVYQQHPRLPRKSLLQ